MLQKSWLPSNQRQLAKGNFSDFQKYTSKMLTNIQAVINKQVQAQNVKPISHLRGLGFCGTILDIFM